MSNAHISPEELAEEMQRLIPRGLVADVVRKLGTGYSTIEVQVKPERGREDKTYFWRTARFFIKAAEVVREHPEKYDAEEWRRFVLWWEGIFAGLIPKEEQSPLSLEIAELVGASSKVLSLKEAARPAAEIKAAASVAEDKARSIQKHCDGGLKEVRARERERRRNEG